MNFSDFLAWKIKLKLVKKERSKRDTHSLLWLKLVVWNKKYTIQVDNDQSPKISGNTQGYLISIESINWLMCVGIILIFFRDRAEARKFSFLKSELILWLNICIIF